jgi:hypothetical protein
MATTKKKPAPKKAKKPAPKKAKKPAAKKAKKPAAKTPRKPAARKPVARRADLGAPIDDWFASKQVEPHRSILKLLREVIEAIAPDAVGSLKWGNPFFTLDGTMFCAVTSHKAHVNLILSGSPEAFDDPHGVLEGEGKTGRHLKLKTFSEVPWVLVRRWLIAAVSLVRKR